MVTPVPAKRGKKPRGTPAAPPASGQVQSLQRGLHLLELIADSHGSVALTDWRSRLDCLTPLPTVC